MPAGDRGALGETAQPGPALQGARAWLLSTLRGDPLLGHEINLVGVILHSKIKYGSPGNIGAWWREL